MAGCWFPHALFLIATQDLDLETETLQAILLGEDSTILGDTGAEVITDIATLDEFDGSGYGRETPANPLWVENAGARPTFETDDVPFGALGTGSSRLTWYLFATDAGGDGTSIPLFFFGRALGPVNPAGAVVTATGISVEL